MPRRIFRRSFGAWLRAMALTGIDRLRHSKRCRSWPEDKAVGRRGEDLAHRYLRSLGFTIVARNYRLATGAAESDLIAREGDELVIVEVKTRVSEDFGPPDRAVGQEKERHLIRVARHHSRQAGLEWSRVRIDVVAVVLGKHPRLALYRSAVKLPNS